MSTIAAAGHGTSPAPEPSSASGHESAAQMPAGATQVVLLANLYPDVQPSPELPWGSPALDQHYETQFRSALTQATGGDTQVVLHTLATSASGEFIEQRDAAGVTSHETSILAAQALSTTLGAVVGNAVHDGAANTLWLNLRAHGSADAVVVRDNTGFETLLSEAQLMTLLQPLAHTNNTVFVTTAGCQHGALLAQLARDSRAAGIHFAGVAIPDRFNGITQLNNQLDGQHPSATLGGAILSGLDGSPNTLGSLIPGEPLSDLVRMLSSPTSANELPIDFDPNRDRQVTVQEMADALAKVPAVLGVPKEDGNHRRIYGAHHTVYAADPQALSATVLPNFKSPRH